MSMSSRPASVIQWDPVFKQTKGKAKLKSNMTESELHYWSAVSSGIKHKKFNLLSEIAENVITVSAFFIFLST